MFINDISHLYFGGYCTRDSQDKCVPNTMQRLVIQYAGVRNYQAHNLLVASSHNVPPFIEQFRGEVLESAFAQNDGVAVGFAKNFLIRDTISHNNGWSGFSTGFLYDTPVTNGAFQDVEAYFNGSKAVGTGGGDQFLFTGCESCYLIRANSHDAYLRGLNFGNINTGFGNMFLLMRDSQFWHNGITTDRRTNSPSNFQTYVYKSGACWSGDDAAGGELQFGVMERSIIAYNREAGGPCAYGQGWASIWNSVWWHNGWDSALYGSGDIAVADSVDLNYFGVFNSIVQQRIDNKNAPISTWTHLAPSGFGTKRCPVSDYNLFVPYSSDTNPLSDFDCVGTDGFSSAPKTYAQPPAFIGPNTLVGSRYSVDFANPTDDYKTSDFHLRSGSSAINAGTFMFRANGGGSGTTIQVVGNSVAKDPTGGSDDPRHYFLSAESYYQATPDTIQIEGCGQVTIQSMTATSITFTPSCSSWEPGAGIHFPWNGVAPDMGVYEY